MWMTYSVCQIILDIDKTILVSCDILFYVVQSFVSVMPGKLYNIQPFWLLSLMTQCFSSRDRRLVRSIRRLPHAQHLHQARPPVCSIGVSSGEGRCHTLPPRQDWGYTAWEWGHPVGIHRSTEPLFYQLETYLCFWHLLWNTVFVLLP